MKQFAFAVLAATYSARQLSASDDSDAADFVGFASKYNKHYSTTAEAASRLDNYKKNKNKVKKLNTDNQDTGVKFAINEASDLTLEEFQSRQNLDTKFMKDKKSKSKDKKNEKDQENDPRAQNRDGRRLQDGDHTTESINYAEMGYVGPVKNQGACGSCWAFAATTVQESMQSIYHGTAPVRLSEQEGVDCDVNSGGCSGGWMSNYWLYSSTDGSQTNADYPYEAIDGGCRNQDNKRIASKAIWWGFLNTPDHMAHDLYYYGPFSIAVSAGNECWMFYSSGILSSANGCPTSIDHGVAVVGIDRTGETPYWIVQNSWGDGWGNNGFIHLAVEEGVGISGMNQYAMFIDVDGTYPLPSSCPNSNVDESQNAMGYGRCSCDDECYGYRECSAWGLCVGKDYCHESLPDLCAIDEMQNEMGDCRCFTSLDCQGDRTCNLWGFCEGESNC